jgi:putative transposase
VRLVRRSYKFRIYPTAGQASRAAQCLRDHQRLYNAALEERREAWRMRKIGIRYGQQSAQLRDIRVVDPDQGRWSFSSQQATLRRLDKAMAAFYRRCQAGKKAGYPRFKALDRWDSVEWPSVGDGCQWKPEAGRVYFKGIGHVKVRATAPRRAASRRPVLSGKAAAGTWCCPATTCRPPRCPRPAARSALMSAWHGSRPPATAR